MRSSSQILIYIDLQQALRDGLLFYLSDNGVILTEGDKTGFLSPKYFARVTDQRGNLVTDWGTAE